MLAYVQATPCGGVGHLDSVKDGQQHFVRLGVAGGDEEINVAPAYGMELGIQTERPRACV